jgi:hypothetical protein
MKNGRQRRISSSIVLTLTLSTIQPCYLFSTVYSVDFVKNPETLYLLTLGL